MAEWAPVTELADVCQLEDADVAAGFQHGAAGHPEPGSWASRAFWHGWRNGRMAVGLAPPDGAQDVLVYRWRAFTGYHDDLGSPVH